MEIFWRISTSVLDSLETGKEGVAVCRLVTFSLVRVFRNLTPPSGGCGPLLGLDRIKRYGCRCSGQTVYTDACAYLMHVVYLCMF